MIVLATLIFLLAIAIALFVSRKEKKEGDDFWDEFP